MKESFFQFSNPELVNIEFCGNENFNEELFEGFSIDNNVAISVLDEDVCNEAQVSLNIIVGEKSESFPFYLSITMSAEFVCDKKESDKFYKLLETNAPALLLSYARPIVSMITSQSGFPTLNLPFMNFKDKQS